MPRDTKEHLRRIGRRGGLTSRRTLSTAAAQAMVKVREARRAYRRFHAQCFWSFDPDYPITAADIPWVAKELMTNGSREAWEIGRKLCG